MQYNDDAIANNESMSNMREYYAQVGKTKILKTEKNNVFGDANQLFQLYTQQIQILNNLSNYAQNTNIREYLKGLAEKSQGELNKLVELYPFLDTSLENNPIFFNRTNSSLNFKKFLDIDLDIIDAMASAMQTIDKAEEREVLFKFLNRHIKALQELFRLMHLLTFY